MYRVDLNLVLFMAHRRDATAEINKHSYVSLLFSSIFIFHMMPNRQSKTILIEFHWYFEVMSRIISQFSFRLYRKEKRKSFSKCSNLKTYSIKIALHHSHCLAWSIFKPTTTIKSTWTAGEHTQFTASI